MTTITDLLTTNNGADPRDREILLAHVLKKPREWVLAHPEADLPPVVTMRYRRLLRRRIGRPSPSDSPSPDAPAGAGRREGEKHGGGEPLPYLLGEQWCYGRPFTVNRLVLIPRPETELLCELAIERVRKCKMQNAKCKIIDIGTGSGCIAVTLAAELPNTHIIATDASPAALRVARTNARWHSVADRITFLHGNLLEPILDNFPAPSRSPLPPPLAPPPSASSSGPRGRAGGEPSRREEEKRKKVPQFCVLPSTFCIVANLPYLTTAEWRALPRSIRAYEPRQALDGGPDGLVHFRELFAQLAQLIPYALRLTAFLEIDPRRKSTLSTLIREYFPNREVPQYSTDGTRDRTRNSSPPKADPPLAGTRNSSTHVRASWHRDLARRWRVLELVS